MEDYKSPFRDISVDLGAIQVPLDYLIIMAVTAILLISLYIFLHHTWTGQAIRATSQDRKGAMLMGINVERMDMVTFGIRAALA